MVTALLEYLDLDAYIVHNPGLGSGSGYTTEWP